jgi:hypothetical protein
VQLPPVDAIWVLLVLLVVGFVVLGRHPPGALHGSSIGERRSVAKTE